MAKKLGDNLVELTVSATGDVEELPAEFKNRTVASQTPVVVGGETKKILVGFGPPAGARTGQPEQQSGTSRPIPPDRRW